MKIILSRTPSDFLKNVWQQKHELYPKALNTSKITLSAEELAGMACEEAIESRLIFTNEQQDTWTCEFGHFEETRFSEIAEKNWTLLVQSLDSFIPEMLDLREAFNFIPKWRLDDVMVSYATPGGGVGPHFDYYDVFLIQLSGTREWKIGQNCNSNTPLRDHPDLKLLKDFKLQETVVLEQGDMIYIPAGLAHWGTALSADCITASIGFRAPAYKELLLGAVESIADQFKSDERYVDTKKTEANDKYLIDNNVEEQLSELWKKIDKENFTQALCEQFAIQVSEVRDESLFEPQNYSLSEIKNDIATKNIHHHPATRFAYRNTKTGVTLYANGTAFQTNLETALAICHSDYADRDQIDNGLVHELMNEGFLIADH